MRMTPTVIVTRPAPQAADFARQLRHAWGDDLHIILSPLLKIVPFDIALPEAAGLVLTSVNGVAQAARLQPGPLPAFCVGEKTAATATAAGFHAVTGPGNADALVNTIIASDPATPLMHIRGKHTRGDVARRLTEAGVPCHDIIAYDQRALPLTDAAEAALSGKIPVVVPLFSPRTSAILSGYGPFRAPLHIAAISDAALPDLPSANAIVAGQPDGRAMRDATIACLQVLVKGDGKTGTS